MVFEVLKSRLVRFSKSKLLYFETFDLIFTFKHWYVNS